MADHLQVGFDAANEAGALKETRRERTGSEQNQNHWILQKTITNRAAELVQEDVQLGLQEKTQHLVKNPNH